MLSLLFQFSFIKKTGRKILYYTLNSVSTSQLLLPVIALLFFIGFGLSTVKLANAQTLEESVVTLINSERQKNNLSSLNYSSKLYQASLNHNTMMSNCAKTYGNTSCFKHTVALLNEATLLNKIKSTGYNPQSVAENIAWGYTSAQSVVNAWMNSSGHRTNILGNYKDIGCDYLNPYWTCDFGKAFSQTTSPTGSVMPTATPTIVRPTTTTQPTRIPNTPTPTKSTNLNVTPAPSESSTPVNPVLTGKPWWCGYVPTHYLCQ